MCSMEMAELYVRYTCCRVIFSEIWCGPALQRCPSDTRQDVTNHSTLTQSHREAVKIIEIAHCLSRAVRASLLRSYLIPSCQSNLQGIFNPSVPLPDDSNNTCLSFYFFNWTSSAASIRLPLERTCVRHNASKGKGIKYIVRNSSRICLALYNEKNQISTAAQFPVSWFLFVYNAVCTMYVCAGCHQNGSGRLQPAVVERRKIITFYSARCTHCMGSEFFVSMTTM